MADTRYPYQYPSFGAADKGYAGIVYRVEGPGTVRQDHICGHNHRHPTIARDCAAAMIRELEARCYLCNSRDTAQGCTNADCGRWRGPQG